MHSDLDRLITQPITRRGLLTAAGLAAGMALLPAARASAATTSLTTSAEPLWAWNEMLAERGPRLTATRRTGTTSTGLQTNGNRPD
jgi:hypothetical protein